MDEVLKGGDTVVLNNGVVTNVVAVSNAGVPLFLMTNGKNYYRYEFAPVKWDEDAIGNTGIGVCAKNGSGHEG
jgi:hypothetical protein